MALFINPFSRASDVNNKTASGSKLYFYQTETLTPADVYTTDDLTTAHAHPVVALAGGLFPAIYLGSSITYRVIKKAPDGTTIQDIDPYDPAVARFLQSGTGTVARTVEAKLQDFISVMDYIPVAQHATIIAKTSLDDHATYIQSALSDARGRTVHFPAGLYNVGTELDPNGSCMLGDGQVNTRILAIAAINSIVAVENRMFIRGIWFDGGTLATNCLYINGSNGAEIAHNKFENATRDNILVNSASNNSNLHISNNLLRLCGTSYAASATMRADFTSGNGVITISSSTVDPIPDLTTLGIRNNYDMVKVTANDASGVAYNAMLIRAHDATTITVSSDMFDTTATGQVVKLLMGSNIMLAGNDSNRSYIVNNTIQSGKVAGVNDQALYGATCVGNTYEENEYARVIGKRSSVTVATIGAVESGNYYEGQKSTNVLVEACAGCLIEYGPSDAYLGSIRIVDWTQISELTVRKYSTSLVGRVDVKTAASASYDIDFGKRWDFTRTSAQGAFTINLPTVSGQLPRLYTNMDARIRITLRHLDGQTVTIKCPTATNINGVDGATGIPVSGNYKQLEAVYSNSVGWTLTGDLSLHGSATYDPPSLADAEGVTTTLTVTGAAVGDYAQASFSNALSGVTVTAWVSATNTESARLQNESGGVLDLASGTLRGRTVRAG